ncbi:MAG: glycerophosphodiester phosphodiesterase [Clostridia bacterium]|nr:glycerophosphodiester phosphodiesterase [Clostridia bacterium]
MYNVNIIAHRGANKVAPQNTIPAFEKAIEMGTDGFETDVHLSKDGVPVICHNYTIDETSNGKGEIENMTLEELKRYDFGAYYSDEFKGTTLPTLDEFLDLAVGKGLKILNIELKPEKDDTRRETLVKKTLEAVAERGLSDILLISSFSKEILEYIKQIDPSCKTAYLYPAGYIRAHMAFIPPYAAMEKMQCHAAHPHKLCIRGDFVEKAHEKGIEVNVWTIDEPEDIRAMIKAGVDGIITDCPDLVRSILNEMNA